MILAQSLRGQQWIRDYLPSVPNFRIQLFLGMMLPNIHLNIQCDCGWYLPSYHTPQHLPCCAQTVGYENIINRRHHHRLWCCTSFHAKRRLFWTSRVDTKPKSSVDMKGRSMLWSRVISITQGLENALVLIGTIPKSTPLAAVLLSWCDTYFSSPSFLCVTFLPTCRILINTFTNTMLAQGPRRLSYIPSAWIVSFAWSAQSRLGCLIWKSRKDLRTTTCKDG